MPDVDELVARMCAHQNSGVASVEVLRQFQAQLPELLPNRILFGHGRLKRLEHLLRDGEGDDRSGGGVIVAALV